MGSAKTPSCAFDEFALPQAASVRAAAITRVEVFIAFQSSVMDGRISVVLSGRIKAAALARRGQDDHCPRMAPFQAVPPASRLTGFPIWPKTALAR